MRPIEAATYDDVDNLEGAELRFRQARQFYLLFKYHHGPGVVPTDTRFLWICYADAFLMTLVSLKDFDSRQLRNPRLTEAIWFGC